MTRASEEFVTAIRKAMSGYVFDARPMGTLLEAQMERLDDRCSMLENGETVRVKAGPELGTLDLLITRIDGGLFMQPLNEDSISPNIEVFDPKVEKGVDDG